MKLKARSITAAASAIAFCLSPALAMAEREYFLVGVRHIYAIGPNRDLHLEERENIEKDYADGVAQDNQAFQKNVDGGADKEKESEALNADLDHLADDRDARLGALFERRDDIRESHPQLRLDVDGPYQVMGINYHVHENVEIFDNYEVFAPWPGYVVVGAPYCGWAFGVVYTPGVFFNLYFGWHSHWDGGRFCGGFYGHGGPVYFHPAGFHDRWGGGRVYGAERIGAHGGPVARGGYSHGAGLTHGDYGRVTAGARGGYSHSTPAISHGYSRSTSTGGYSHTTPTHTLAGAGGYHSSPAHTTTGSYSHAGSFGSHPSTTGGYSHGSAGSFNHTGSSSSGGRYGGSFSGGSGARSTGAGSSSSHSNAGSSSTSRGGSSRSSGGSHSSSGDGKKGR